MTKKTLLVTFAAILGLGAAGACASRSDHGERADKAYGFISSRVDDALDDIDATDVQREKVNAVKDRLFEEAMSLREDNREARLSALEELERDQPDANKLHALVDSRMDEARKMMHEAVDGVLEVHGSLTPEQRAELVAMIEEKMAKHDH
jgi:Spy/CpxP family protein refolding chaperone